MINAAPLNVYFNLHYNLICCKELFFPNVYISASTIFESSCLLFGSEIGHPLSTYATEGMWGLILNVYMCVEGGGVSRSLSSLFNFLSYGVLFYLKKFNLNLIQKGCVCQEWSFFSNESNFCCHQISFFCFELFF